MTVRVGWHIVALVGLTTLACGQASSEAGGPGSQGGAGNGTGGGAEPVVVPPCKQGIYVAQRIPDPRVRETHSGLNGEFTDTCENGALIQYDCGTSTIVGPPSDPATWTYGTGQVVSVTIECGGRCVDGACPNACPNIGDEMRCLSVVADGHAIWRSTTSGWTYECDVNSLAGCASMPEIGDTAEVVVAQEGLLTSKDCVTEVGFAVGIGTVATCWYAPCSASAP